MSLEIARRVKALEARVAELETLVSALRMLAESNAIASKPLDVQKVQENVRAIQAGRSMCPKCGVAPNHFFHVKNCRGQQQKNDDRNRDPGTT